MSDKIFSEIMSTGSVQDEGKKVLKDISSTTDSIMKIFGLGKKKVKKEEQEENE